MGRTNADRAADARLAFEASPHSRESNDEITNLYDLVCDLLHLADTMNEVDGDNSTWEHVGDFVLEMAEMHYNAELAEEAGA